MDKIVSHYRATIGASFSSLRDLHIKSLAGHDAVLAIAAPIRNTAGIGPEPYPCVTRAS